jgi:peptidoglycan/LPS O-acetylase OafA/YrhL
MTFGPLWFYLGPPNEFGAPIAFFLQRTWCAPAFAALIVAVALQRGPVAKLLSFAPLILLGEISYAVYLTHPALLSLGQRWLAAVPPALGYVVFLGALLTVSWAIWRYIETPCRNWIRNAYDRRAGGPARQQYVASQGTLAARP